jgi:hypothetical protein
MFDHIAFDLHVFEVHKLHTVLGSQCSAHIFLCDESTLKQSVEQPAPIHIGTGGFDLRLGQQTQIAENFNCVFVSLGHLGEEMRRSIYGSNTAKSTNGRNSGLP